MEELAVVAIVQARTGSTRLRNKIFLDIEGKPLIEHVILRLLPSKKINKIVIATTENREDDKLENWAKDYSLNIFRGSEKNVLARFYNCARYYNADIIVRITADDPLKDYRLIDKIIDLLITNKLDFVTNNNPPTFPEGLDVEAFTMSALSTCYINSCTLNHMEHVTQYVYENIKQFKFYNLKNNIDLSRYRWTLDTKEDYLFIKEVYKALYKKNNLFLTQEIYNLIEKNERLIEINSSVKRSIQYKINDYENK